MIRGDDRAVQLERESEWILGIDKTSDDWIVLTGREGFEWFALDGTAQGSDARATGNGLACTVQ
jgi:hypothetical protein